MSNFDVNSWSFQKERFLASTFGPGSSGSILPFPQDFLKNAKHFADYVVNKLVSYSIGHDTASDRILAEEWLHYICLLVSARDELLIIIIIDYYQLS